jgi:hypothetical protein
MTKLYDIALKNIKNNIISSNGKKYITAGSVQFRTLWIRDFGYSVDALYDHGFSDIINNTIILYLNSLRPSGPSGPSGFAKKSSSSISGLSGLHGPKCFDSINPEWRTVVASIRHTLGLQRVSEPIKGLKPYMYRDSRNSVAIDSNIMICLAAEKTGIHKKCIKTIKKLIDWYQKDNGLIVQDAYSDFQDSQSRKGKIFTINLLYYVCLKKYKDQGYDLISSQSLDSLKNKIIETFYDNRAGIFVTQKGQKYICLLDNLLAIKYNFSPKGQKNLYNSLKNSKLWSRSKLGIPGFATYPNYDDIHIQVLFGNLSNYHNDMYWGWLMAFSGIIAYKMNDISEGHKIYNVLNKLAIRDGCISEIYKPEPNFPIFESFTYSSERPFTMSACYALELAKNNAKAITTVHK